MELWFYKIRWLLLTANEGSAINDNSISKGKPLVKLINH